MTWRWKTSTSPDCIHRLRASREKPKRRIGKKAGASRRTSRIVNSCSFQYLLDRLALRRNSGRGLRRSRPHPKSQSHARRLARLRRSTTHTYYQRHTIRQSQQNKDQSLRETHCFSTRRIGKTFVCYQLKQMTPTPACSPPPVVLRTAYQVLPDRYM